MPLTESTADTAVDTSTLYMGLRLRHPFMAGASPLSAHLDGVRRLEDAGTAAIVLPSLFEEQITEAASGRIRGMDKNETPEFAARLAAFPAAGSYRFGPDAYLEHVRRVKQAVRVPVIASLNGTTAEAWLQYATLIQDAGADALELNFYEVLPDLNLPGVAIEREIVAAVTDLKRLVRIPVAVKLSPFFTAFGNMATLLDQAGVDGLILFNRFYQTDIDTNTMTATPTMELSHSAELVLRLRWLAILHGRVRPSLAVTGGAESWNDGVKAILAGAHVVQMVSALLRGGPGFLTAMVEKLVAWMTWYKVASVEQMRGRVSLSTVADAGCFERANYIRSLHVWESRAAG
jgi:dihydroorotate dehydrogenase (fumarate)